MNRKIRFVLTTMVATALTFSFASCESDEDVEDTSNEQQLVNINTQYVDGVVLPTYKSLSNSSIELYKAITNLKANKTDENVAKVAELWKSTRVFWEESEAFLFGPVDVLGIDPHIDTWPMVETSFNSIINNNDWIQKLDSSDGDKLVSGTSDGEDGVLGFHSIEYIIFRNGKVRAASEITDKELIFAVAVAGDLRNQCCMIEAGWLGESGIGTEKAEYVKRTSNYSELQKHYSTPYATTMKVAPNNIYSSALASTKAIIDGAIDIADEVGAVKIGKPYNGASEEDKNYIESKYSYNSKVDFAGNIRSIQNAYLGGVSTTNSNSVSNYLKSKNASLDQEIKEAIGDAITKIDAIDGFETNAASSSTKTAMEACQVLLKKLEKAKIALGE